MLSRVCASRSLLNLTQCLKSPVPQRYVPKNYIVRNFSREERERVRMGTKSQSLWEKAMAPPGPNAFSVGKGAIAGASAVLLGALCYYGTSSKPGTLQESHFWPQYVKDRIQTTYMYMFGSLMVSAASAYTVFSVPALLRVATRSGWVSVMVTMAAMIGSGMLVQQMEYKPGFGAKQLAWIVHTGIMGAVIAPLCFLGGPILTKAALYTAGIVGGLSTIAICAPSEEFLNLRAPLAMGLGIIFASSMAGIILPPTTALGAGLYSISLYGGLILFSGFLLFDTQMTVKKAEKHPPPGYGVPYDPVNAAISVYLDVLNIFVRMAMILATGNSQRRK